MNISTVKRGVVISIIAILLLTVLEFPAPVGFETRPQNNVSMGWLVLFLAILISEIAAIPLILKRTRLGAKFGFVAAILNILQVIADQAHLMQPEVAPLGYSILEYTVALFSLSLLYFSMKANVLSSK